MNWSADTPVYLPLGDPPTIRRAAERLVDTVARILGERPDLRHQPAPFGRPGILLAPDPAYTAAVAPDAPETFCVLTSGAQLIVTGADSLGTIYGIEYLGRFVLPRLGDDRRVDLRFELPPWPVPQRWWAGRGLTSGALLRLGYNAVTADEASHREAGLRRAASGDTTPRDWFSELLEQAE